MHIHPSNLFNLKPIRANSWNTNFANPDRLTTLKFMKSKSANHKFLRHLFLHRKFIKKFSATWAQQQTNECDQAQNLTPETENCNRAPGSRQSSRAGQNSATDIPHGERRTAKGGRRIRGAAGKTSPCHSVRAVVEGRVCELSWQKTKMNGALLSRGRS